MNKIAKNSEALFGERYRARQNKKHEFFFCSKCKKKRRTNPLYYPDSDESFLMCSECYSRMYSIARDKEIKAAELLQEGTTIYYGKKAHQCDGEEKDYEEIYYKLSTARGPVPVRLYRCKSCGQLIIPGNKFNSALYPKYRIVSSKQEAERAKRERMLEKRPELASHRTLSHCRIIEVTDFLTRTTIRSCTSKQHEIEDIQVAVKVLHRDYSVTVEIAPALYCKTCNKYFLLEEDYTTLKSKGILLCNVVEQSYWSTQAKDDFYITNPESLLYKMGYNVSANNNLYQSERHSILKAALENGLITKAEILSHLDYLIRRSQGRVALADAVNKWKQDRGYVQGLSINSSGAYYGARTIIHKSKK